MKNIKNTKNILYAKKSKIYRIVIILLIIIIIGVLLYYNLYLKKYDTSIKASYLNNHINYKKKKICLLYSGEVRQNYFNTLFTHILMFNNVLDIDAFCVFTDTENTSLKEDVSNILHPKKIEWINEKNNDSKNFMYLLYGKIHLCNKLKIEYETENKMQYDLCIRIRPDLYIKNYLPEDIVNDNQPGIIYSPYHDDLDYVTNISFMGLTDQLWAADSRTMDTICNLYINLSNYDNSNCMTSEIVLKTYIKEMNIKIQYFKNYYFIIERINNEKISIFSLLYYFFNKYSSIKCYKLLLNNFYKKYS